MAHHFDPLKEYKKPEFFSSKGEAAYRNGTQTTRRRLTWKKKPDALKYTTTPTVGLNDQYIK